jgi:hypothetical protein
MPGAGRQHNLTGLGHRELTSSTGSNSDLLRAAHDLIINSAVYVDLEASEANPNKAWLINAVGKNLALAAQQTGSALFTSPPTTSLTVKQRWIMTRSPSLTRLTSMAVKAWGRLSLQLCPQTYACVPPGCSVTPHQLCRAGVKWRTGWPCICR